jgi:hypothetical protein
VIEPTHLNTPWPGQAEVDDAAVAFDRLDLDGDMVRRLAPGGGVQHHPWCISSLIMYRNLMNAASIYREHTGV